MKTRLRGQSVRLRLGQSEVRALARGQDVTETTRFGPGCRLTVTLHPDPTAVDIALACDAGVVVVRVPKTYVDAWVRTDAVGFSTDQPVGDGQSLRVLIEKDFECLDSATEESQADAFPNPSHSCS